MQVLNFKVSFLFHGSLDQYALFFNVRNFVKNIVFLSKSKIVISLIFFFWVRDMSKYPGFQVSRHIGMIHSSFSDSRDYRGLDSLSIYFKMKRGHDENSNNSDGASSPVLISVI